MSALGRFGRFTLFHHLSHLPITLAVSLFVFVGVWGGFVLVFCLFCRVLFSFLQVSWNFSILRAFWTSMTDKA